MVSAGEEQVEMPDFRNYEITNIEQILKSKELNNYTITEEYSDSVESGYLIRQSPSVGTKISKKTSIEIVVSIGPETKYIDVVDVRGKTLSEAKRVLNGLNVRVNEKVTHNKDEDGVVLEQDENNIGKKIEEGASITLTVGKYEEEKIDIASLISKGMSVDEATNILVNNGISYELLGNGDLVESFTSTIKKGEVVKIKTKKSDEDKPLENENNSENIGNSGNNPLGNQEDNTQ